EEGWGATEIGLARPGGGLATLAVGAARLVERDPGALEELAGGLIRDDPEGGALVGAEGDAVGGGGEGLALGGEGGADDGGLVRGEGVAVGPDGERLFGFEEFFGDEVGAV